MHFLSFVEQLQPQAISCLLDEDRQKVLKRQTEAMVNSTSFMYEALMMDDPEDDY